MQLHPQEFIYKAPSQKDWVCNTFIYEPANIEEIQLGNLYLLGKIKNIPLFSKKTGAFRTKKKYKDFEFFLNQLASVIKREFYSNPKRGTPESFEAALNKANSYLADFIEKGETDWMGNIHFVSAAFSNRALHLSQTGNTQIQLLRGGELNNIGKKLFSDSDPHPLKTFLNIASGELEEEDRLIFSTGDLLNIITLEDLENLLKHNSPLKSAETLQRITHSRIDCPALACLILEAGEENLPSNEESLPRSGFLGQPTLVSKEEPEIPKLKKDKPLKKDAVPSPASSDKAKEAGSLDLKKIIGEYTVLKDDKREEDAETIIPKEPQKTTEEFSCIKKSPSPHIISIAWSRMEHIQKKIRASINKIQKNFRIFKNKKTVVLAILIITLLITMGTYTINGIGQGKKFKEINNLLAKGWELQKEIEASLIYQNKEQAGTFLQQARLLTLGISEELNKLSKKKKENTLKELGELEKAIQEEYDSFYNIVKIENLDIVNDLSNNAFDFIPKGLAGLEDYLYIYETGSGSLYKIDLEKNSPPLFFFLSQAGFKYATTTEKAIIFFNGEDKLHFYDSQGNHDVYKTDPSLKDQEIKDFGNYLTNIYFLNIKNKDILKYSKKENSDVFEGNSWIKEAPEKDLENAINFAIDGYVYVLKSNGTISKYLRGEKISEINPKINPPLSPVKIYTKPDFKNLYLLDPTNKRVAVLNKKGEVVKQYINDEFSNLLDFWITKDEKEVYLLCGEKIYKIAL